MSKKLTISIPDDVHKRLENFRDRIALSSVCAQALREAMDNIEIYVLEAKKRFHILSIHEACSIAFRRGISWAGNDATIEELAIVCLCDYSYEGFVFPEEIEIMSKKIENLIEGLDEPEHFIEVKGYINDLEAIVVEEEWDFDGVLDSFVDGARVVWKEIEDMLIPMLIKAAKQDN